MIIPHVIIIIMIIMSEQSVPPISCGSHHHIIFTSDWECDGMIVAGVEASLG